jgi:hypothetical protein
MTARQQFLAEASDKFLTALVISLMLFALDYATGAATHLVSPEWAHWLDGAGKVLGLLGTLVVLFIILSKFLRMTRSERRQYLSDEGYLMEMFRRAGVKAFFLTWLLLAFSKPFLKRYPLDLPGEFYAQAIMAFMLATFAILFAFFARTDNDENTP